MEQEKVIQLALSESEFSAAVFALTNTGKIFVWTAILKNAKGEVEYKWNRLPCPVEDAKKCKHPRTESRDGGEWRECLDCHQSVPLDAGLLEPSQVF